LAVRRAALTERGEFGYLYNTSPLGKHPPLAARSPHPPMSVNQTSANPMSANQTSANPPAPWLRQLSLGLLVGYWLLLFVSTHIPQVPPLHPIATDKVLHLSAYTVLAALLATAWSLRGEFGWRQCLMVVALLTAFAAFDEISQIPVGRHCDARDAVADVVGVLVGLAIFLVGRTLVRRAAQYRGVGGR
jgi:VanZ family protein